jgi:GNAT superfamily N-acetyltransferase
MIFVVGPVDPSRTFALRQRVLRPDHSIDVVAADNNIAGAITFGASEGDDGPILATATIYPEDPPAKFTPIVELAQSRRAWRLRAVATEELRRSEGLGKLVLESILDYITQKDDVVLWCYARVGARAFYERERFSSFGEIFVVEEFGPHIVMYRKIDRLTDV